MHMARKRQKQRQKRNDPWKGLSSVVPRMARNSIYEQGSGKGKGKRRARSVHATPTAFERNRQRH